jgi:hypothetical protein
MWIDDRKRNTPSELSRQTKGEMMSNTISRQAAIEALQGRK